MLGYDAGHSLSINCTYTGSNYNYNYNYSKTTHKCTVYCSNDGCINLNFGSIDTRCCIIIYSDTAIPSISPTQSPTNATLNPSLTPSEMPTNSSLMYSTTGDHDDDTKKDSTRGLDTVAKWLSNDFEYFVGIIFLFLSIIIYIISFLMHKNKHKIALQEYKTNVSNVELLLIDQSDRFSDNSVNSDDNDSNDVDSAISDNSGFSDAKSIALDYETGICRNSSHGAIFCVFLTIFDVFVDIGYIVALMECDDNLIGYAIGIILTIIGEILFNCYFLHHIYVKESKRNQFGSYVHAYVCHYLK